MSFELTWEADGVRLIFDDNLNNSDYLLSNEQIISDPRFIDLKYITRNYLKVTTYSVDSSAVRRVAALDADAYRLNADVKIAIISDKIITKGLLNMFLLYMESELDGSIWQTELFETEQGAEQWLQKMLK